MEVLEKPGTHFLLPHTLKNEPRIWGVCNEEARVAPLETARRWYGAMLTTCPNCLHVFDQPLSSSCCASRSHHPVASLDPSLSSQGSASPPLQQPQPQPPPAPHPAAAAASTTTAHPQAPAPSGVSAAAVRDAAAAPQRCGHHVHAGGDGHRAPAARACRHGRGRHRPAAAHLGAGGEQGCVVGGRCRVVVGVSVDGGAGAAAVAVRALVLRAARGARDSPRAGRTALPMGDARPALGAGGARGVRPSQPPGSRCNPVSSGGAVASDDAPSSPPIGHGPGALGAHHVLPPHVRVVLRGPVVAGERRPPVCDVSGHLPRARFVRPALPVLSERADGAWPDQHPVALRVRQLSTGRGATSSATHAAVRLCREARRVLRGDDEEPSGEQTAPGQGAGVGGRARTDVLAYPPKEPSVQEEPAAQLATPRAVSYQQTVEGRRKIGDDGCASVTSPCAAPVLHQRLSLHVLKSVCGFLCELLTVCVIERRRNCDIKAQAQRIAPYSNYVERMIHKASEPIFKCNLSETLKGKLNSLVTSMNQKRHRTRDLFHSYVLDGVVLRFLLKLVSALPHYIATLLSIKAIDNITMVPTCRYVSVFY